MDLNGKNLLFVAGLGGIGFATCQQLMRKGLKHLYILDKTGNPASLSALQAINSSTTVQYEQFDVTVNIDTMRQVFKRILDKIGIVHLLINGAGIVNERIEMISKVIQVNLEGLINTSVVAFEQFDKRYGGPGLTIVNIASCTGIDPVPIYAVYSATKAAVVSFTRSCAYFTPVTGISVFAICPGLTKTSLSDAPYAFMNLDPQVAEHLQSAPWQTPEQCGKHIIDAIEENKNGALWIIDLNVRTLHEPFAGYDLPKELQFIK